LTATTAVVMKLALGLAKKATTAATSSGRAKQPSAFNYLWVWKSVEGPSLGLLSVSIDVQALRARPSFK
jgi:hypothetical protein